MVKQYTYNQDYDQTILTTRTVGNIVKLFSTLIMHIAPSKRRTIPEMKDFRRLKKDFNHANQMIGRRGKQNRSE